MGLFSAVGEIYLNMLLDSLLFVEKRKEMWKFPSLKPNNKIRC
jgi:hypothetical protein